MKYCLSILFCCLCLSISPFVSSCDFYQLSFCNTGASFPEANIIQGKIINYLDDGIELQVFDVLRGIEQQPIITIWNGSDFDCNGPHSMAASQLGNLNDTIVAILPKIESVVNEWDVIGDYRSSLFWFHTHHVIQHGDSLFGYFTESPTLFSMHLNEYDAFAEACSFTPTGIQTTAAAVNFSLYPNPSKQTISIDAASGNHHSMAVKLYTIDGQLSLQKTLLPYEKTINIESLSAGMYLVEIAMNGILVRKKLVVSE